MGSTCGLCILSCVYWVMYMGYVYELCVTHDLCAHDVQMLHMDTQ